MDKKEIKKSPIKKLLDNLNANKNMFITRVKILKQLKSNGNDVNIDTIQKVFNINIINTNSNKDKKNASVNNDNSKSKKDKKNKSLNNFTENNNKKKNKTRLLSSNKLISLFCALLVLITNFSISNIIFAFNNIEFNTLNEQFISIINRTIQSPQTDIYLKSKYDTKTNSIIYFYEIVDNLDSYKYYIKNTSVNDELKLKLLKKIFDTSKEIKNINTLNLNTINSISLIGDSYIIDNKYIIKDANISGKDINLIISSIKNNNIKQYNTNKKNFLISSCLILTIFEGFIIFFISIYKKYKKVN